MKVMCYCGEWYTGHCKKCEPLRYRKTQTEMRKTKEEDSTNPSHYKAYKGIEVIQLTEQLNFNKGNAIKYIARAGLKNQETETLDLKKALWYIKRELQRLEGEQ